jgi:hypothetical protein
MDSHSGPKRKSADSAQGDGYDIAVSGIRVPDFIHGWESQ